MRQRVVLSVLVAMLMTAAAAWAVAGQAGGVGSFEPFSIHVMHQEPVTVVATATTAAGEVVTVTTPITVGVDLRIDVTGLSVVSVESAGPADSEVAVEPIEAELEIADALVDVSGIPFEVIAADGVVVDQVRSSGLGDFIMIEGVATNGSDDELAFVSVSLELYDVDDALMGIEGAATNPRSVEPGDSFTFEAAPLGDIDALGRYVIRVD